MTEIEEQKLLLRIENMEQVLDQQQGVMEKSTKLLGEVVNTQDRVLALISKVMEGTPQINQKGG